MYGLFTSVGFKLAWVTGIAPLSRTADSVGKEVTQASSAASPTVNKVVDFVSSSEPATLGKIAIALVAFYYLAPYGFKVLTNSVRGYAGMLSAPWQSLLGALSAFQLG